METFDGEAIDLAKVLDHFPCRHAVVDGRVGGDETDLATNFTGEFLDVKAVDDGGSACGLQDSAEDSQRGCFAGTVWTEEAKDLSGHGVKADALESRETAGLKLVVDLG